MFKRKIAAGITAAVLASACFYTFDHVRPGRLAIASSRTVPPARSPDRPSLLAQLPLHFEPVDRGDAFRARGPGYALALDDSRATLLLNHAQSATQLTMQLADAQRSEPIPEAPLAARSHYLLGNDASAWRTDVPHYARVRYPEVYEGVDLVYYGAGQALEYDFLVAPGADPAQIRISYSGARDVSIDAHGDLRLAVDGGEVVHRKPVLYQTVNDRRVPIEGAFKVLREDTSTLVTFDVGAYDTRRPLVIDPVLTYASYLGGSEQDNPGAIAVDASGAIYVTGLTTSNDFPTANAAHPGSAGLADVVLLKLNPQGTALEYSTYLGGSDIDQPLALRVGAAGTVFVAGRTLSTDFPTVNAAQSGAGGNGNFDVFVARLDAQGSALLYSTYLGGSGDEPHSEFDFGLDVDSAGHAYVYGGTDSADFPVSAGAPQPTFGGVSDVFVTKLSAAGNQRLFSTYHGGDDLDEAGSDLNVHARSFAIDGSGSVWITGQTYSDDMPVSAGAVQSAFGGGAGVAAHDGFVARFDTVSSQRAFSTFLGGNGNDSLSSIAVDSTGNAYVAGQTRSADFPVTAGALDTNYAGGANGNPIASTADIVVAKLDPTGTQLLYATYLGGNDEERNAMLRLDASGAVYVAGSTASANFPISAGAFDPTRAGDNDGFIAKLNGAGSALLYSTYIGDGGDFDAVELFEIDSQGNAYAVLTMDVGDASVTNGGLAYAGSGNDDAYFAKISANGTTLLDGSYFGGSGTDRILAMALDSSQVVYFVGETSSTTLPVTPGAIQSACGGGCGDDDMFIARFATTSSSAPPQHGTVQLNAASYSVIENGGSVTLTLTRTNGADGVISVSVTSGGGSAAAGADYTPLMETVSWGDADTAPKTVSLTILNDTSDEPDETVVVTLANVSGGATLGSQTSTTITMIDDDETPVPQPPSPSSPSRGGSHGGGAMEWFVLAMLGLFAAARGLRRSSFIATAT